MSKWFAETFSTPELWISAKLEFSRSVACMSMIGHLVGLGDRHGENILIDETSGGCVHVDFNCLFDKVTSKLCHLALKIGTHL